MQFFSKMIIFFGYWCTIKIFDILFGKGGQIPAFYIFGIQNSKTRQMEKIQWIQHCGQHIMSSNIWCLHLLLIYTCWTFPCWHDVAVSCFPLRNPLFISLNWKSISNKGLLGNVFYVTAICIIPVIYNDKQIRLLKFRELLTK